MYPLYLVCKIKRITIQIEKLYQIIIFPDHKALLRAMKQCCNYNLTYINVNQGQIRVNSRPYRRQWGNIKSINEEGESETKLRILKINIFYLKQITKQEQTYTWHSIKDSNNNINDPIIIH